MYATTRYASPLGPITLACGERGLCGLWFEGQAHFGGGLGPMAEDDSRPVFAEAAAWLDAYFAGEAPDPAAVPLAPEGTPFRQAVWALLREIPAGSVVTYGDLARELGRRQGRTAVSARAVGGAVGHNPISLFIPCHRVVGAGGSLTGYAGGLERKGFLLELEGADPSAPCRNLWR